MSLSTTPSREFAGNVRRGQALLELCEPVFLYVCRINRAARVLGADLLDMHVVRTELQSLLNDLDRRVQGTELADPFSKIRLPLIFFIDDVIAHSGLPFANTWPRLAVDEGQATGDDHFYDLLDITLDDPDLAATDRLAVYFVAMGLGFEGKLRGDRHSIDQYLARITARIGNRMVMDEGIKICPEAYHHTDRRPLAEPVTGKLFQIGLAAAVLIVIAFAINGALYFMRTNSLKRDLIQFHQQVHPTEQRIQTR